MSGVCSRRLSNQNLKGASYMNELKTFENPELGAIRTVEINGEPWMVGKDVALALGYRDRKSVV